METSQSSTMLSAPPTPRMDTWLDATLRGALIVWALAWSLFAIGVAASEGGIGWLYAAGWVAVLAVLAWMPHRWPRAGAALLVVAGIFAMLFFDHWLTRLSLAAPAILMGLVIGWRAHRV